MRDLSMVLQSSKKSNTFPLKHIDLDSTASNQLDMLP